MALQRRVFLKGDAIIKQGETPEGMYFLADGDVKVVKGRERPCEENGWQSREILDEFKGDQIVGEMSLLAKEGEGKEGKYKPSVTIRVTSDSVNAYLLPKKGTVSNGVVIKEGFQELADSFLMLREWISQVEIWPVRQPQPWP